MSLIRPRLTDYFDIPITQDEVDFAIPFLDEDIPLYIDPFLLWRSPSQQDNALHTTIVNSFNRLGKEYLKGKRKECVNRLVAISECSEVGLGTSKTKKGLKIGKNTAIEILDLYKSIDSIRNSGFLHFEEIQLYVNNISKDRISDFASNFLKSFLIDFTQNECNKINIPMRTQRNVQVYDYRSGLLKEENVNLPFNPENNAPIILVPKRWLRYSPWINFEDYFVNSFVKIGEEDKLVKPKILDYNRNNYDMVQAYISSRERVQADCKADPLFKQIPIISAKRSSKTICKLSTGKTDNADKKYEREISRLFASLMYPHLDFAEDQCRVESGAQIRDLIFYNNVSHPFLKQIYETYDCKQIVFEMKNVKEISRDHINQLNRYLSNQFGRFGIIVTRNPLSKRIFKNTIDLWAGQRKCIICLSDEDVRLMVNVYESKQRDPYEVIKKKYVEFMRACPA